MKQEKIGLQNILNTPITEALPDGDIFFLTFYLKISILTDNTMGLCSSEFLDIFPPVSIHLIFALCFG